MTKIEVAGRAFEMIASSPRWKSGADDGATADSKPSPSGIRHDKVATSNKLLHWHCIAGTFGVLRVERQWRAHSLGDDGVDSKCTSNTCHLLGRRRRLPHALANMDINMPVVVPKFMTRSEPAGRTDVVPQTP